MSRIIVGDCRESMRALIAEGVKVQMCVTSPPYWGLRDYGVEGQLGLEPTIGEYVANMVEVFGLVRDLLADDGTLWLNLGDSYSSQGGPGWQGKSGQRADRRFTAVRDSVAMREMGRNIPDGLKPKDLCGIPWRVAFALQQPQYLGRIKSEVDRSWLAAMIDAEGCFFIHRRKAGTLSGSKFTRVDGTEVNYARTADTFGVGLEICNTSVSIIERVQAIVGGGTVTTQEPGPTNNRRRPIFHWRVQPNEAKRIAEEVYPYLVAKQQQARLVINCPSSGDAGRQAHLGMIALHRGHECPVDFKPPKPMFGQGWWLRQDIIWSKSNPMPESIRDRCTKSHEYIFLMAKSERYLCDMEAIAEPVTLSTVERMSQTNLENQRGSDRVPGKTNGTMHGVLKKSGNKERKSALERDCPSEGVAGSVPWEGSTRNKRSVWTVATQPYSEAHFATYPPALIEPCILAGSKPGDIVFDPFFGSGTTGEVAQRLGRDWIGCELSPEYAKLAERRTSGTLGLELHIA